MNVAKARDTLALVEQAVKYRVLTDEDLNQIASIVQKRIEKIEEE